MLNVSEDHMDRYDGMADYHLAKHRIFRGARQVVVNRADALTRPLIADTVPCWSFGLNKPDFKAFGLIEEDGQKWLAFQFDKLLPVGELKIRGAHNYSNALAALALGHAVGLPFDAMLGALKAFSGLAHRCQWVRERQGVSYYDDSKATNVGAALAAIEGWVPTSTASWCCSPAETARAPISMTCASRSRASAGRWYCLAVTPG